jgi:hypothetical protein
MSYLSGKSVILNFVSCFVVMFQIVMFENLLKYSSLVCMSNVPLLNQKINPKKPKLV